MQVLKPTASRAPRRAQPSRSRRSVAWQRSVWPVVAHAAQHLAVRPTPGVWLLHPLCLRHSLEWFRAWVRPWLQALLRGISGAVWLPPPMQSVFVVGFELRSQLALHTGWHRLVVRQRHRVTPLAGCQRIQAQLVARQF